MDNNNYEEKNGVFGLSNHEFENSGQLQGENNGCYKNKVRRKVYSRANR